MRNVFRTTHALDLDRVRYEIDFLDNLDCEKVDYRTVYQHVDSLLQGTLAWLIAPAVGQSVARARRTESNKRPIVGADVGAPPAEKIKNFQRCNHPGHSMFYCSNDPFTVLREVRGSPGDTLFISEWQIRKPFAAMTMPPRSASSDDSEAFRLLADFIERRFKEPIDDSESNRYMITAALTECYAHGRVDENNTATPYPMGAVYYSSVKRDGTNFAIKTEVARQCLALGSVMEVRIDRVDKNGFFFGVNTGFAQFKPGSDEILANDQLDWQELDDEIGPF